MASPSFSWNFHIPAVTDSNVRVDYFLLLSILTAVAALSFNSEFQAKRRGFSIRFSLNIFKSSAFDIYYLNSYYYMPTINVIYIASFLCDYSCYYCLL